MWSLRLSPQKILYYTHVKTKRLEQSQYLVAVGTIAKILQTDL